MFYCRQRRQSGTGVSNSLDSRALQKQIKPNQSTAGSINNRYGGGGSMMALGRLPTLGLNKYTSEHFRDDTKNPFYVQKNTETMLVVRELEREFKDLNKFEQEALKVHQKGISTR